MCPVKGRKCAYPNLSYYPSSGQRYIATKYEGTNYWGHPALTLRSVIDGMYWYFCNISGVGVPGGAHGKIQPHSLRLPDCVSDMNTLVIREPASLPRWLAGTPPPPGIPGDTLLEQITGSRSMVPRWFDDETFSNLTWPPFSSHVFLLDCVICESHWLYRELYISIFLGLTTTGTAKSREQSELSWRGPLLLDCFASWRCLWEDWLLDLALDCLFFFFVDFFLRSLDETGRSVRSRNN